MTKDARRKLLNAICDDCGREPIDQPYQITSDSRIYELATDGRVLMAIQVESSDLPKLSRPAIREWLGAEPQKTIKRVTAFCEFIRLYECELCPACKGTGKRDAQIWDSRSDDEWLIPEQIDGFHQPREVLIDGQPINANLLARTLNGLKPDCSEIYFRRDGDRFTFRGDGWIVVIMGFKPNVDGLESLPKWDDFSINEIHA